MRAFLGKHWFLIALAICFTGGYLAAEQLQVLKEMGALRTAIVFSVMWAMGVTLNADTIRSSLSRPLPSILAIAINTFMVPLVCLPLAYWLPDRLFGGLFIAAVVPCTLASASVWTRKAGGDDSVAMMTTVVTNLACLMVVPVGVSLVLSASTDVSGVAQMKKLGIMVVLPLVIAQAMRKFGMAEWADRNKPRLSVFGQLGILSMVVFGSVSGATAVSVSGAPPDQLEAASESFNWLAGIYMVFAAILLHVIVLVLAIVIAKWLKVGRGQQIAIGIAGSQKTLMVGLPIAIDCGVSVVPMLVYHLGQLVIDTLVAQKWKSNTSDSDAIAKPETAIGKKEEQA